MSDSPCCGDAVRQYAARGGIGEGRTRFVSHRVEEETAPHYKVEIAKLPHLYQPEDIVCKVTDDTHQLVPAVQGARTIAISPNRTMALPGARDLDKWIEEKSIDMAGPTQAQMDAVLNVWADACHITYL